MLFRKKPQLKFGQAVTYTMPSVSNFTPPCSIELCTSTPRMTRVRFNLGSDTSEENPVEFHAGTRTALQNSQYVNACVCASPHEHGAWNSHRTKLRHTSEIAEHAARAEQMAQERRKQRWTSVLKLEKALDNTRHALHVLKKFLNPRPLLACVRGKTDMMRRRRTLLQWERLQEFRRSRSLDCLSVQELIDLKILLEDRLRGFEEPNCYTNNGFTSSLPSVTELEQSN